MVKDQPNCLGGQLQLPTYREDPCISIPLEGPDIEVRPVRTARVVKLHLRIPEDTRLRGARKKVVVFSKKKADPTVLQRMLVGVVEDQHLYQLLRSVEVELGLPKGWASCPTKL